MNHLLERAVSKLMYRLPFMFRSHQDTCAGDAVLP